MRAALGLLALALGALTGATAAAEDQASALRIAVAPFERTEGDALLRDPATLLADRLASRPLSLVVAPSELEVPANARPEARDVRRWAEEAGVEAFVVGSAQRSGEDGVEVAVDVRSGHSGASLGRYRTSAAAEDAALDASIEKLAASILSGLGYPDAEAPLPAVAMAAEPEGATGAAASGEPFFDGLPSDEPIAIESEELEVITQEQDRQLIFRRNVRVVQGNVTLRTDRLEAFYPAGASQPSRLDARGRVRMEQGDRNARCDEATYLREDGVVVCRGHAELTQGCDQVRGERIRFDLNRDHARVEGAASVVIHPEGCEGAER
jgi:lipopolysaccharide transport protein LptA